MINAHWEDALFDIQEFQHGRWKLVADTARESPARHLRSGRGSAGHAPRYRVRGRSIVVLMSEAPGTRPAVRAPRRQ